MTFHNSKKFGDCCCFYICVVFAFLMNQHLLDDPIENGSRGCQESCAFTNFSVGNICLQLVMKMRHDSRSKSHVNIMDVLSSICVCMPTTLNNTRSNDERQGKVLHLWVSSFWSWINHYINKQGSSFQSSFQNLRIQILYKNYILQLSDRKWYYLNLMIKNDIMWTRFCISGLLHAPSSTDWCTYSKLESILQWKFIENLTTDNYKHNTKNFD